MDETTDMVVLVSKAEGVIVNGIIRKLSSSGVNVVYAAPNVNEISALEKTAGIFVLYISDDIDSMRDAIVYINDIVKAEEKDLVVIGERLDRSALQSQIPDIRISQWYERPLDADAFVIGIKTELKVRQNRISTKSVLVVDDDPSYVKIVREWLKTDYQVFVVTSGMQAISFLMKKSVDLVLLDYEMPVTTGAQVFRMLRSEPETAGIPVVFLTGVGDAESVKQVIALKPDGYILKSTSKQDLLQWIKVFFAKRS